MFCWFWWTSVKRTVSSLDHIVYQQQQRSWTVQAHRSVWQTNVNVGGCEEAASTGWTIRDPSALLLACITSTHDNARDGNHNIVVVRTCRVVCTWGHRKEVREFRWRLRPDCHCCTDVSTFTYQIITHSTCVAVTARRVLLSPIASLPYHFNRRSWSAHLDILQI